MSELLKIFPAAEMAATEAKWALEAVRAAETRVDRAVAEYRQELLNRPDYQAVSILCDSASKALRKALLLEAGRVISQAWAGNYGRGTLVHLVDQRRIARVVRIPEASNESWRSLKRSLLGGIVYNSSRILSGSWVVGNHPLSLLQRGYILCGAEVNPEISTQDEIDALTQKLYALRRLDPLKVQSLFQGFGEVPPPEPGYSYQLGSCDHHSGYISAVGVLLPTGRTAVITEYTPAYSEETEKRLYGVFPSEEGFTPELSAKHAELKNKEQLLPPTTEEREFLLEECDIWFFWDEDEDEE